MGHKVGTSACGGKGKGGKGRANFTCASSFPNLGIYFGTKYVVWVAGGIVPKPGRVKGVYVQCLSVRSLVVHDTRSWAALSWEPQLQEQFQGPG